MRESGESGQSTGVGTELGAGGGEKRRGRAGAEAARAASESGRTPDDLRRPDAAPLEDEVRRRAYELYEGRGGADGNEVDDWVRAEREVSERRGDVSASRPSGGSHDREAEIRGDEARP